jgi:3-aminobutyryl-CoA ammonia-lyase
LTCGTERHPKLGTSACREESKAGPPRRTGRSRARVCDRGFGRSAIIRRMTEGDVLSTLRVRVGAEDVHYGGGLVAGAYAMKLFGDLATEATIRTDGHEGLLRAYEDVEFLAPVAAGDYLEARATLVRRGATSRTCEFTVHKVIAGARDGGPHARVLDEPILVARARGTTIAPKEH